MRFLVASATAFMMFAWFGIRQLGPKSDWMAYYTAGSFLITGKMADLYNLPALQAWQATFFGPYIVKYLYPPAYSLLFFPFAYLELDDSRIAWAIVCVFASLGSAWISTRWNMLSFLSSFVILFSIPALAYGLISGQISHITLLIFTIVASSEWSQNRGFLPGVIAGLALYKPQLLIVLVFFWLIHKRWHSLVGFAFTGIGVILISLIFGFQTFFGYMRLIPTLPGHAEEISGFKALTTVYSTSPLLALLLSLAILAVVSRLGNYGMSNYGHALLWLSPLLVTPYLGMPDMLLVYIPVSFLIPLVARDRLMQLILAAGWTVMLISILVSDMRFLPIPLIALFILCTWRMMRPILPEGVATTITPS